MKIQTLLAGVLLSTTPVLAAADTVPSICKSAVNYAVQALEISYEDGSFNDKYNPKEITIKRQLKLYPAKFTYLGNCDEDAAKLKQSWCQVAGGSPSVFQADVAQDDGNHGTYPVATVIVTYNRGGCWVDEAIRK